MEPNIAELLRSTAKNIGELFNMLANRVEQLEKENEQLRSELQRDSK
jgi:cell shape-determining protein MreC